MRLLAAALTVAAILASAPAHAQAGWGMSEPVSGHVGELSRLSPTHRYWTACRGGDAEAALHACGRVIGARVSQIHTASAHYFRSIALEALGEEERALRDLRRAYFSFTDLFAANEEDPVILYGRGLSLVRLGYRAEGEADMARAVVMSEGRAGRFFGFSDG